MGSSSLQTLSPEWRVACKVNASLAPACAAFSFCLFPSLLLPAELPSALAPLLLQLLIADFFFILFALAWFAAGLAQQSATQSTVRQRWWGGWVE